MSLPQASTVHLRGQTADLSWRALTGFVGQLDGQEIRLMIRKEMWEKSVNIRQHWEQRCINKTDVSRQTLSRSLWQRWGLVFRFLKKTCATSSLIHFLHMCTLFTQHCHLVSAYSIMYKQSSLAYWKRWLKLHLFIFFADHVHFLCFPCLNLEPKIESAISVTSPWGKFVI